MIHAPIEGQKVKVTIPAFQKLYSKNEWVVVGAGRMANDGRIMHNCKPISGTTIYQFFKEELELI